MTFKKKTNIVFIIVFLLLSISVGLFNYIVDPYGIRDIKANNFCIFHVPKDMVYTYINQTKKIKFDSVVIGGSSTGMVFFPKLFFRDTNENCAVLAYEGISPSEMYKLLEYFISMHSEVERVYVSIEPLQYINSSNLSIIQENPASQIRDFIKLYYSIDVLKRSLNKIKNFNQNEKNDEDIVFTLNQKLKYNYEYLEEDNAKFIKEIKNLLDKNEKKYKFFILPLHSLFLSDLYYKDRLIALETIKRKIVEESSFYDFAFINEYTKNPFEWLWRDIVHLSQFISPYVYEVIYYDEDRLGIATLLDSANIEDKISKQRKLIESYMQENKEYVDNYLNYDFNAAKDGEYTENRYLKDIPEPYKTRFFAEYNEYYKNNK